MHDRHERTAQETPQSRRQPLRPLSGQLPDTLREFVLALRALHERIGLSLSDLARRLPVSRSTLSRHLRGESVPDEQLLELWCALCPEGDERLPELLALLGRLSSDEGAAASLPVPPRSSTSPEEAGATAVLAPPGVPGARAAAPPGEQRSPAGAGSETGSAVPSELSDAGHGFPKSPSSDAVGTAGGAGEVQAPWRRGRLLFGLSLLLGCGVTSVLCTAATMYVMQSPGDEPEPVTAQHVVRQCRAAEAVEPHSSLCAKALGDEDPLRHRQVNTGGGAEEKEEPRVHCPDVDGGALVDEVGSFRRLDHRVPQDSERRWHPGLCVSPRQLNSPAVLPCAP